MKREIHSEKTIAELKLSDEYPIRGHCGIIAFAWQNHKRG